MSPRISDFAAPESGSSSPILVDGISDIDQSGQSGLSSPYEETEFKIESQVNEPVVTVDIVEFHDSHFIDDRIVYFARMSASWWSEVRSRSLELVDRRVLGPRRRSCRTLEHRRVLPPQGCPKNW